MEHVDLPSVIHRYMATGIFDSDDEECLKRLMHERFDDSNRALILLRAIRFGVDLNLKGVEQCIADLGSPSHWEAGRFLYFSVAYMFGGEFDLAETMIDSALELNPTSASVHSIASLIALRQGRPLQGVCHLMQVRNLGASAPKDDEKEIERFYSLSAERHVLDDASHDVFLAIQSVWRRHRSSGALCIKLVEQPVGNPAAVELLFQVPEPAHLIDRMNEGLSDMHLEVAENRAPNNWDKIRFTS